jgi:hypothetical protein
MFLTGRFGYWGVTVSRYHIGVNVALRRWGYDGSEDSDNDKGENNNDTNN